MFFKILNCIQMVAPLALIGVSFFVTRRKAGKRLTNITTDSLQIKLICAKLGFQ
jgi:hypothetical protein